MRIEGSGLWVFRVFGVRDESARRIRGQRGSGMYL